MSTITNTSASYLPDSITSALQTLEETITQFLTSLFDSLPLSVQTYLLTLQSSPYLTRTNLQYTLRLIVIISTYLLFRPHLEALFRRATGAPDARREELQNRLKFLQDLKEGKIKPQGGVEVVDGKVVLRPNPVRKGQAKKDGKAQGRGKVVKLVVPGEEGQGDVKGAGGGGPQTPAKNQSSSTTETPNTRASTRRRKA